MITVTLGDPDSPNLDSPTSMRQHKCSTSDSPTMVQFSCDQVINNPT